jgi:hypothetical protein
MEGLRRKMLRKSIIIGGIVPLLLGVRTYETLYGKGSKTPQLAGF